MDMTGYETLRSQMQSGDALAIRSTGLLGWAIRWRTKSSINHVGLLIRLEEAGVDRLFILHAVGSGVLLMPVSRYLAGLRGEAAYVPLVSSVTTEQRCQLVAWAMLALGRAYDWWGVLRFVFPWIQEDRQKLFCSELAALAYRDAGLVSETWRHPQALLQESIFGAWHWL